MKRNRIGFEFVYGALERDKLKELVKKHNLKYYLDVGIFSDRVDRFDNNELNNAEIGALMEFGSVEDNIPPRPFLSLLVRGVKARAKINKKIGKAKNILNSLGEYLIKKLYRAFNTRGFGTWAPNAPLTVKKKGFNKPLIDTRQLLNSISYRIGKIK